MRHGNLFVISGPSGAGKGTLVDRIVSAVPDAWVSVSATTRKPRPGEQEGVHYYFLSDEEFDRIVEEDGFLEWAHVHTSKYGTLLCKVREHMDAGDQVILEIDVQGGFQVKEKIPEAVLIFVEPPSTEELRRRLEGRGTEEPDVIDARMEVAKVELSRKMEYDIQLVNDNLDTTVKKLEGIINDYACNEARK